MSAQMATGGDRFAVFGRETRYVATLYLQRGLIFVGVILAIVLSLDVASNVTAVFSKSADASSSVDVSRLAYYIVLRAGYVMPSVLPISAIAGVLWAEYGLTRSRERQMISGSGRSPFKSLLPAMLFGLVIGTAQFVAIAYVRPLAVAGQATAELRYYGAKFADVGASGASWFAVEGMIINARVDLRDGVTLRDLRLFQLNGAGKVIGLLTASTARPGPGNGEWTLQAGSYWDVRSLYGGAVAAEARSAIPFQTRQLPLSLDPLWVKNFDISPPLLDQASLSALALGQAGIPNQFGFRAALTERYASALYCLGMALLGASMALVRFSHGMKLTRPLGAASAGAVAYVGFSACSMFGTFGSLPPDIAAWIVPLALISGSLVIVGWRDWRAQNGSRRLRQA